MLCILRLVRNSGQVNSWLPICLGAMSQSISNKYIGAVIYLQIHIYILRSCDTEVQLGLFHVDWSFFVGLKDYEH